MSPRATDPGYRRSRRPCSPASRIGTGHLPLANLNRAGSLLNAPETNFDAHGSYEQAGPVGWGDSVTCDRLMQVPAAWAARGELTSRASGWVGYFWRPGGGTPPDYTCRGHGRPRGAGRDPGRRTWPGAPSPHLEIGPGSCGRVREKEGFYILREHGVRTKGLP